MRYWKCIGNEFNKYFTIDKIYSTDDNGYDIKDDKNDKYPTKVIEMCSAKFEEVKEEGENKMEDLRELIKPCYVVVRRDGSICGIFATNRGLKLQTSLGSGMCFLEDYNKNLLKEESEIDNTDIMKIYSLSKYSFDISINNRHLIWKRIELSPTQLKLEELEKKQREIADEMEKLRKEL